MIRNLVSIEVEIGTKKFQFLCDSDSSTEHCKEALFQFLKHIGQIEDKVRANQNIPKNNENEPIVDLEK